MCFRKFLVDVLLLVLLSAVLVGNHFLLNDAKTVNDGRVALEVKQMPLITKNAPKAKLIPFKTKNTFKADISNALVNPKANRPIVINI